MIMRSFTVDNSGASAAEFALVLPLGLLLLFGVIDVGNYAWELNKFEKATQMGVRYAVVTDIASVGLADDELTYVNEVYCSDEAGDPATCKAGDRIAADALGQITCTLAGCDCTVEPCPSNADTLDVDALNGILGRMQTIQPRLNPAQVAVEYRGSGIGFAGDPNKPEIAPIVTIRVNDANYSPIVLSPFSGTVPLPDFSYSLTLEDGEGTASS